MTARRPLVIITGAAQELPVGDTVVGAGGGSSNFGTVTIDFGASPGSNEATVDVTGETGISSTSKVSIFVMGSDTSVDHTAADHKYLLALASFVAHTVVTGVGFTVGGRSIHKMQGKWTLRWTWGD